MREIKFRAWDKNDGMIYTCLDLIITPPIFNSLDFNQDHYGKVKFYKNKKGEWNTQNTGHSGVLMQFTGLKDKNGKEIYEGDMVLCADAGECFPEEYNEKKDEFFPVGKYEVVYQGEEGYPAFELKDSPCEDVFGLAYAHANSIEVIGNIFENPDLIKGEK